MNPARHLQGPGSGTASRLPVLGIFTVLAVASGCKDRGAPVAAAPPPVVVTVSQPLQREVTDSLNFTGTTAPLEAVEISSRVTGFLDEVHFEPKAYVAAGDVLFNIDPRPFQTAVAAAKAELDARKAQLIKAEFDAERTTKLKEQESAGEQEYVDAIANRDLLRAGVEAAQARLDQSQLNLDWCQVTAPISGRITRNLVDAGNIVTADHTMLATIVNDKSVYVYFTASERDVLTLREKVRADNGGSQPDTASTPALKVLLALMTEEGFSHEGQLDYTAPTLDADTGTMQVRAQFDNADGVLLPGLFVRLHIPISKPYQAFTVTERALGSDQGRRYVLVVNPQNVVEYRPVEVGALTDGLRVLSKGVAAEEWVIVNGLQRVRPGATVAPQQAAMPVWPATGSAEPPEPAAAPAPAEAAKSVEPSPSSAARGESGGAP